ncbi:MAG: amino acid ABC transporter permease [Atopostipes sp.]|nr:amino acid ABC transporter permease [Atopostipes sp.]
MIPYLIKITPYIFEGFKMTFGVFLITLLFSIPLALLFLILSQNKKIQPIISAFTWLMRGTPLILQLYFFVFALPIIIPGFITRNAFIGANLAFILNYSAYFTEIFKGGLSSIDSGQWEAAQALNLNHSQTAYYVIFPQMIRNVLYPLSNEVITLVKDTSLITVVGLGEIFRNAKEILLRDLRTEALLIVAIIYLLFTFVVIQLFKQLKKKWRVSK